MLALVLALASLSVPARAQDAEIATVSVGRITIDGEGTSEVAVRRALTRHLGDVRTCWAVAHVAVALPLSLTIAPDGSVEEARATLDGADRGTYASCVADAARRWRFPPHEGASIHVSMSLQVRAASMGYGGEPPHGLRTRFVPARVRVGRPTIVHGRTTREIVARVMRRHENELRFCYEQSLASRPELAGALRVGFIIAPTGAVQTSSMESTTLGEPRVEGCVLQAFRRWTFPAPDGGGIAAVRVEIRFSTARR